MDKTKFGVIELPHSAIRAKICTVYTEYLFFLLWWDQWPQTILFALLSFSTGQLNVCASVNLSFSTSA